MTGKVGERREKLKRPGESLGSWEDRKQQTSTGLTQDSINTDFVNGKTARASIKRKERGW